MELSPAHLMPLCTLILESRAGETYWHHSCMDENTGLTDLDSVIIGHSILWAPLLGKPPSRPFLFLAKGHTYSSAFLFHIIIFLVWFHCQRDTHSLESSERKAWTRELSSSDWHLGVSLLITNWQRRDQPIGDNTIHRKVVLDLIRKLTKPKEKAASFCGFCF